MNTLTDKPISASCTGGYVIVKMGSGGEIRFPIAGNPRLEHASEEQLNQIELSPFGLHWPGLDEDLSFRGIAKGDYGQKRK